MARKYFGTDGIRGRANGVITAELALKVGQAVGLIFQNGEHRHRVLIGKDTRLSGYMIENALTAGFTSVGMDVLLTGPIPTPGVAMLTRSMRADLGVMISASHNPFDDNGIKLFGPDGYKLSDEIEKQIEELIDSDLSRRLASAQKIGRARRIDGVQDRYIEFAKRTLPRAHGIRRHARGDRLRQRRRLQAWRPRRCGSSARRSSRSASSRTASTSTRNAARPRPTRSPARCARCAPTSASRSTATPTASRSSTRRAMWSTATSCSPWWRKAGREDRRLAKPTVVATVMSNLGFERHLKGLGLTLARTPVGDRYMLEHMREGGFNLGGEPSGHIIMSDYATTGDGFVAALQVLAVVKKHGKPVSEVCHRFDPLPQVMKNVRYRNGKPLEDAKVKSAIEAAVQRLDGQGRLIIRASGTEPVIRVMGEGENQPFIEEIVDGIVDALSKAAA